MIVINLYRDSLASYGSSSSLSDTILEDSKGRYRVKTIWEEVPCECHPETCSHMDGKRVVETTRREYL